MSINQYSGNIPKNYEYLTSVKIINRVWDIYLNRKELPYFIKWKITLHSGKYPKANYWLNYSIKKQQITHNQESEKFYQEFPDGLARLLEDISFFLSK